MKQQNIHKDWYPIMNLHYQEPLSTLFESILPEISYQPQNEDIFRAFEMPLKDIKVVILGQDPYPSPHVANGLAFAVNQDTAFPVSLKNIAKEIGDSTLNTLVNIDYNGNIWKTLEHWKDQGVFLLNTALTVETGKPGSHLKYWEEWTKRVISHISVNQPCIWLFWGSKAQKYIPYIKKNSLVVSGYDKNTIENIPINDDYNYVLQSSHPAAEAYQNNAGFFGCNHFYYVNSILKNKSLNEIKW